MHRICHSLATNGYRVTLVGRQLKTSLPLLPKSYQQKRLSCYFNKSFLFYLEYNTRLFFYLLGRKMDAVCAIDLDTILPCLFISRLKRVKRIYDAHEYFTELKEVRTRPLVQWCWSRIEQFSVPRFKVGYTVSEGLAAEFAKKYQLNYCVIRNLPVLTTLSNCSREDTYLFYGGAVNEARGFEVLIPAMRKIDCRLVIVGDGNFMGQLKALIDQYQVGDKVELKGMQPPELLRSFSEKATLGVALAEKEGVNQYLALPNKFLDYIHAALPQVTMNYPEYVRVNQLYKVAVLIDELTVDAVVGAINGILLNDELLEEMQRNCLVAREKLNWQREEKELIKFYQSVFPIE